MRFGLSDEQKMLDDSVRGHLARSLSLEKLREIAAKGDGFDAGFARGLAEQGVTGVCVPEDFGGAGLGMVEAVVIAEALGRAATPFGAVGAVMGPLAIARARNAGLQAEMLPAIAAGERRVAIGFSALAGTTALADVWFADGRLSGSDAGVMDAGGATDVLIALSDGRLVLVDASDRNVGLTLRPSVDRTRPIGEATFDGAAGRVLDTGPDPMIVATQVRDAGRLMIAADSLGAGQRMIDSAVAYANEREQFGRKIGGFQAVKHMCAELVSMLEPCRSLVWYAAFAQDRSLEDACLVACHAKAHLGDVTREVARMATEIHGGMGFTDLLGLHFWFKRITFDRQALGAPERCRAEAAALQGWKGA